MGERRWNVRGRESNDEARQEISDGREDTLGHGREEIVSAEGRKISEGSQGPLPSILVVF